MNIFVLEIHKKSTVSPDQCNQSIHLVRQKLINVVVEYICFRVFFLSFVRHHYKNSIICNINHINRCTYISM